LLYYITEQLLANIIQSMFTHLTKYYFVLLQKTCWAYTRPLAFCHL